MTVKNIESGLSKTVLVYTQSHRQKKLCKDTIKTTKNEKKG